MLSILAPSGALLYNETNTTEPTTMLAFLPLAIVCCVSIGVPLNLLIAVVIIAQKRLHKPRHIFWLGVIFSNLFAQLISVNELLVFYILPGNKTACWTFVFLLGIPYATLLLNLLLGSIDRFVAITYPIWHRNNVTIKLIVTGQFTGLLLLTIVFKTSFFVNGTFETISCHQPHPHGKIIVLTLMSLVLLCVVTQIAIFLKTKTYFLQQREGRCQAVLHTRADLSLSSSRLNPLNISEVSSMTSPEYFVHIGNETISKLEVEATWTLAQGVTSLGIISSPVLIVLLGASFCSQIYDDCTAVTWMIPYFRELVLVHTIYNPIMYICRSQEFRSAIKRKYCLGNANVT
jgi:hypothetical protein